MVLKNHGLLPLTKKAALGDLASYAIRIYDSGHVFIKKGVSYKIAGQMISHCNLDFFKPLMIKKYIFVGLILCLYISQKIQKNTFKKHDKCVHILLTSIYVLY